MAYVVLDVVPETAYALSEKSAGVVAEELQPKEAIKVLPENTKKPIPIPPAVHVQEKSKYNMFVALVGV